MGSLGRYGRHHAKADALPWVFASIWLVAAGACLMASLLPALPYMFTRGRSVPRGRLFYGCPHAEEGCATGPIAAERFDPRRIIKCTTHKEPMIVPMVKA